ncbi:MAG TPA: PxKF domain-containing protein [Polyangiales bacterium]|nr:PxKF domain-containing protein [Polyangiales bacterium]
MKRSLVFANGKVLVAGGSLDPFSSTESSEVYDPIANTWSLSGAMLEQRGGHNATVLLDGRVFVVNGGNFSGPAQTAELYDPQANTWSLAAAPPFEQRGAATATLLPTGLVLLAGGHVRIGIEASTELYDPALDTWTAGSALTQPRMEHTATSLESGEVLVAGGIGTGDYAETAEIYAPGSGDWTPIDSMSERREQHAATLLTTGEVLVVGGWNGAALANAEVYGPSAGGEAFDFAGFFSPVDNPPAVNKAKAGSAVPIKFSLHGDHGLDVLASGSPTSSPVRCGAVAATASEKAACASSKGLSYDARTDRYTYVWKTAKAWSGTCRTLIVKLSDGSEHKASFKFH